MSNKIKYNFHKCDGKAELFFFFEIVSLIYMKKKKRRLVG